MTDLHWLPHLTNLRESIRGLPTSSEAAWAVGVSLANTRLNFVLTDALDARLRRIVTEPPADLSTKPVRLAMLGSCTLAHLHSAIRVAGLRRGIWIDVYESDYGQYMQELADPQSALHRFKPDAILLSLDAYHLSAGITSAHDQAAADARMLEVTGRIAEAWRLSQDAFHCPIIQQAAMPVYPPVLGSNEHRLPGSRAGFLVRLNAELRRMADSENIDLLAIDERAGRDGVAQWHDTGLWHRAKQEIALPAAPLYGDLLVRILAAKQGRSAKCLVLDLDNTLWGGVVGDDGLDGLIVGQGSALGEAFVAFQDYVRELSRRGVILAVCSKNDEANALEPFDRHPDMVLRRQDIACFIANWSDKPANIRTIAQKLNIGLDSLVFIDDNPFERNLVRRELPMVSVPEVGEDPTGYIMAIADAGYFEGLSITDEDRERTSQYLGNRARETLRSSVTDLETYLHSLEMQLVWSPFDNLGVQRIVQLINKSNQFNLTTRRYTVQDVQAVMADPLAIGLQFRLIDRFGDNGVIAIVIGRLGPTQDLLIDTWLMSCRVLGRQVETTTLNVLAAEAKKLGARRMVGEYVPTKKNGMVRDHYARLGFSLIHSDKNGRSCSAIDLAGYQPNETVILVTEG